MARKDITAVKTRTNHYPKSTIGRMQQSLKVVADYLTPTVRAPQVLMAALIAAFLVDRIRYLGRAGIFKSGCRFH
jgi:hypothetical protein